MKRQLMSIKRALSGTTYIPFYYIIAFILLFCLSALNSSAQKIVRIDGSKITIDSLNNYLPVLMQKANVQGLAIAVFNDNKTVYKKTFGYSRADKKILFGQNVIGPETGTVYEGDIVKVIMER